MTMSERMRLQITLPWPSKLLSPNGRPHWAAKGKAVAAARGDAKLAAIAAMRSSKWKTVRRAVVSPVFYDPVVRRRDRDNHAAMLKSYYDGFADAGVIENDCGFTHEPVQFAKGERRVEIVVSHGIELGG
jgi:crossover junction endodeoxyribonuclease RusA